MATTPTGLINTDPTQTIDPNQTTVQTAVQPVAAPAQATTTPWNVTPEQTVQGQIKSIIDENSPLMKQAETRGLQQANKRGLINSSIGVQAGQAALYEAATPIATADAATYGKSAGYNADQLNQTSQFNTTAENTRQNLDLEAQNRIKLQEMSTQGAKELAQINNENQRLIQTNTTAASLMNQATGVINNIMMNDKMDAAAKTEASRQVVENLRTHLSLISSTAGLGLSDILGTGTATGTGTDGGNPYDLGENPYNPTQEAQVAQAASAAATAEAELSRLRQLTSDPEYAAMLADFQRRMREAQQRNLENTG